MTDKVIVDKVPRILKSKKQLETKLKIKISNRGREIYVEGDPLNEYVAMLVIEAIDFGFKVSSALRIKEQDNLFEVLNIKDYTKRRDLERIRGRIIGKEGRTLKTLRNLTGCDIEVKDNKVGIVGSAEDFENAQNAVISIIRGAKQSNAYAFVEKNQPKPIVDLGIKKKERLTISFK